MGKRGVFISYFLHILLHVFIFIGFIAVAPLVDVYFNYTDFVKRLFAVEDVVICPPNCTVNLALVRHDSRAVIVMDNPSATPVALNVYTTWGLRKLITTDRTTRLEILFDGGLYVNVHPLYPLSDAEPRSVYLPSGGNLTIRITPPAIGGAFQTLIAVIGTIIGIMASLGIIRRVTRTPLVNAIGATPPTYFEPLVIWFILSLTLVVVLQYWLTFLNILRVWLPSILIVIYTTILLFREPEFKSKIMLLFFLVAALILSPLRTPYPPNPLLNLISFLIIIIILVNPITLIYFKSLTAVEDIERVKKIGILHLYDLTLAFWTLQWLINPYPAIFKQIFYNLPFQLVIINTFVIILIYLGLFFVPHLVAKGSSSGIFLLSMIPFVFNEELAARIEFCRRALDWPTRVKVYPEGGEPVVGFIVKCDVDKVAISDGETTHVFSWGDLQKIKL